MVFLLDASTSVTPRLYSKEKDFVKSLITHFNISPSGTRGSAIIYGNASFTIADFSEPNLIGKLDNAPLLKTPRKMDKALKHAARTLKSAGRAGRRIVILLTTGTQRSGGESFEGAKQQLQSVRAQTFVVAVGRQTDIRQLYYIVNRPNNIYRVEPTDDLQRQSRPIAKSIHDKPGMKQQHNYTITQ